MTTMNATTRTLSTDGATITYDIRGELPTADGRPPLVMIGQPMTAAGFTALASHFSDRTVVTYDPRGLGRSTRGDGRTDQDPTVQAQDLHALVEELGAGPVDVFASSGGAVTALAWVTAYPQDIATLVAHEPPMIRVLPDADQADRAFRSVQEAYRAKGWGAGMAQFVAMTMWQGEITDEFLARPPADPAQFGMPTEDDGSRDDPLLSGAGDAVSGYRPAFEAIQAAPTRVVIAVGVESQGTFTDRTSRATAQALGQEVTVFPSHHGGFLGDEFGQRGEPEAFAARLHEVLDH
jgi:pimeloyl-ACP methyl ester carboxylesterase